MLGLAITQALFERFPDFPEGRLTTARAYAVSRESCAEVARSLGLGERLVAGSHEAAAEQLAESRNVLAALVEAVIGALYVAHGFDVTRDAVVAVFSGQIEFAVTAHVDYKTELQEELARRSGQVRYAVVDVSGPVHDRTFTCVALVDGEQRGTGSGPTKKAAEQAAAREALASLASGPG